MEEFAVKNIDVVPKPFTDVLFINPLELLIYFIFWELLLSYPFIFFKLGNEDATNWTN